MIKLRKPSKAFEELGLRLMSLGPCFVTGATAGFAALSGFYGFLGPFPDLGVLQLVAGLEQTQGAAQDEVPRSPAGRCPAATKSASAAKKGSAAIHR